MRRLALAVLLSVAVVVTLVTAWFTRDGAEAQQPGKVPRLGVLLYGTPELDPNLAALRQGLSDLGYVDSRTIKLEYRYAAGKPERLRDLAAELVAAKPDAIVALGGDVAPSARAATTTIPIVAITSYALAGDREKCHQAGCSAYFEKPIDPLTIVEQIHAAIGVTRQ